MDWQALRSELPVTQNWAFLDHAAVAPLTARAQRAMHEWVDDMAGHGIVHLGQWIRRVEEIRQQAARLINADPQEVAFIKNTSEGVGFVAEGFPWKAGDNVVTAAEEYPANVYPWMNLARRGVEVRLVPSRERRLAFDDVVGTIDDRTRLLSLSFVEFASGQRNDLDRYAELCRQRGVRFFVDAIQGLGVLPLDVRRTPIDFLAADGHKWLLGPEGAGIFYIRKELVDQIEPVSVGWNSVVGALSFSKLDFRLKPNAGRWENGTMPVPGIIGLGASLDFLMEIGIPTIRDRVLSLTDHFCEKARQAGCDIYSSRTESDCSGIVSFTSPSVDPRDGMKRCRQAGILINVRGDRMRISPHCYNTPDELDHLLNVLTHPLSKVASREN